MRGEETIQVVDGEEGSNRFELKVRMNLEDGVDGVLASGEVARSVFAEAEVIGVGHVVGLRFQQPGDE